MANNKLGKITLPPQPQPSPNPQEYVRNVGIWTREVEQAIRQIERALQGIDDNFTSKEDFDTLSNRVNSLNTGSSGGGGGTSIVTVGPIGPAGPAGPPGRDGTDGIQGPAGAPGATWYSGAGNPSSGIGSNNDYYLDTGDGDVFKKVAGSWVLQGNIRGPTGASGSSSSFVGARLQKETANQSITGYTVDVVTFPHVKYDTGSLTGVANKFTIQTNGYYLLTANITFDRLAGNTRSIFITNQSGDIVASASNTGFSTISSIYKNHVNCSAVAYASAGNQFFVQVLTTSTESIMALDDFNHFSISKLGS